MDTFQGGERHFHGCALMATECGQGSIHEGKGQLVEPHGAILQAG